MISKEKEKDLSIDDFVLLTVIGKGSYAKVLLVKKKDSGEIMALKILKKEVIEKRKQEEHVKTERNVLVISSSNLPLTLIKWSIYSILLL